jgi:hypothetical protein
MPAKSLPGMRGKIVPSIFPWMFFTSLGFIDAANILTFASPFCGDRIRDSLYPQILQTFAELRDVSSPHLS